MNIATEFSTNHGIEVEINTDSLIKLVSHKSGLPVFDDSFGDGVALVGGGSYKTYHKLARAFGIDINAHLLD